MTDSAKQITDHCACDMSLAVPPSSLAPLASAANTASSNPAIAAAGFLSPQHAATAPAAAPAAAGDAKSKETGSSGNSSSRAGDKVQAHLQQLSQLAANLAQDYQSVVKAHAVQEEAAAKQQQKLEQQLQEERAGKAAGADKLSRTEEELSKWRGRALEAEGALAAAKQSLADEQAGRAAAAAKLADVEGQLAMLQEQFDGKVEQVQQLQQELEGERNPTTGPAYKCLREWQGAYDTLYEENQQLKEKLEAAEQQQQGPRQEPPTPTHNQQQGGHFVAGMAPGVRGAWSQGSQSPVDLQQHQHQVGAGAGGHLKGPPPGFGPGAAAPGGWGPRGGGAGVGALLPDQMGGGPIVGAGPGVDVRGFDASGENGRGAGGFGQQQQEGGDMGMLTDDDLVQLVLDVLPGNVAAAVGMAEVEARINQKLGQGVWQQVYARRYGGLGAFLARTPELFGILDQGLVYRLVGMLPPQGGQQQQQGAEQGGYGWGDAAPAGRGPWGSSNYQQQQQQQREQESYQQQQEGSYGQHQEQRPQPQQGQQQYQPGPWGMAPAPPQQQDSSTAPAAGPHSSWGGPYGPNDGEIKFGDYSKGLNYETISSGGSSDAAAAAGSRGPGGEGMGGMGGAGDNRNPLQQLGNMEGPAGPSLRGPPGGYEAMPWGPPRPGGALPPTSAPVGPFLGPSGVPPAFGYDGAPPRNLMPPIPGLPMSLPMGLGNPGPLPSLPMALHGPYPPGGPSTSMGFPGMLPRGGLLPGGLPYPPPGAGGIGPSSSSAMAMYPPATGLAAGRDASGAAGGGGMGGMGGMGYMPYGGGFPHGPGMGMEGMKQGGPPRGMMQQEMVVTPCAPHMMPPASQSLLPNDWSRTG